jgi:putative sporulation protein YyaC
MGSGERRVSIDDPLAAGQIGSLIGHCLPTAAVPPVVVCIGTDRSTGDALGPLIGTQLARDLGGRAVVYGTLDNPVHAGNLEEYIGRIKHLPGSPAVIAVDACLGSPESVGTVAVGCGPLRPGAGVNKSLPAVGDVYLTGVVNVGGFMEYFVLQNTRLSLVVRMARVIADGVTIGVRLRSGDAEAAAARNRL